MAVTAGLGAFLGGALGTFIGGPVGTFVGSVAGGMAGDFAGNALYDVSSNYLDSPSTTSQITYKLQGTLGASYSGTYYVNITGDDNNNDFGPRTPSNLTAIEILA